MSSWASLSNLVKTASKSLTDSSTSFLKDGLGVGGASSNTAAATSAAAAAAAAADAEGLTQPLPVTLPEIEQEQEQVTVGQKSKEEEIEEVEKEEEEEDKEEISTRLDEEGREEQEQGEQEQAEEQQMSASPIPTIEKEEPVIEAPLSPSPSMEQLTSQVPTHESKVGEGCEGEKPRKAPETVEEYRVALCSASDKLKQGNKAARQAYDLAKKFSAKVGRLQQALKTREAQLEDSQVKISELFQENQALLSNAEEAQERQADAQRLIQTYASLQDELNELRVSEKDARDAYDELAEEGRQLSLSNHELLQESRAATARAKAAEKELATLKEAHTSTQHELLAAKEKIALQADTSSSSSSELNKVQANLRQMEAALKRALDGNIQLENEADALREQLHASKADKERTATAHAKQAAHLKELQSTAHTANEYAITISRLRAQIDAQDAARTEEQLASAGRESQLQRQVQELRDSLSNAEGQCESLSATIPNATKPLQREIKGLQQTIADIEDNARRQKQELLTRQEQLCEEKDRLEAEKASLAEKADEAVASRQAAHKGLSVVSKKLDEAHTRIHELQQQIDVEHDRLEARYETLFLELAETKRHLQDAVNARQEAEAQVERLQTTTHSRFVVPPPSPSKQSINGEEVKQAPHTRSTSSSSLTAISDVGSDVVAMSSADLAFLKQLEGALGMAASEGLRRILRRKTRDINHMSHCIDDLRDAQRSLTDEMVALKAMNTSLQQDQQQNQQLRQELHMLNRRHQAALQVIVDKGEEIEDLRQELAHVQEVFRSQIAVLLEQQTTT